MRMANYSRLIALVILVWIPTLSRAQGSSPTSFFIDSAGPVTLEHYSANERLRIVVQLSTTDETSPESSEGEGCIHVGFQSTLPSFHGLNIPCDVYLNYNVIYTVPSDSLTGYDLVADFPTFDGDESAIITVTVNPVEVVKSTFDEVEHFENLAAAFEKGALNAKISEQLCVIMPTKVAEVACERMEAVLEIEYEAEAMYYQKLAAQDPVDSNFREIATPRKCTQFPPAQDRFTDAVDALVSNEKSQTYLLEAILTSINRASGAKEAGNDYWRRRQLDAAAFYSLSLSEVMESEIRLQAALSHAWTAAGYPSLIPAASDVHNAQLALYSAGFSPSEIQQLEQDGLAPEDISALTTQLVTLDFNQVVAIGGFPTALTYDPFVEAQRQASKSLIQLGLSALTN